MTRRVQQPDEMDEGPSADDIEQFSDVTRKCPKCDAEMYDDVEICWNCGHSLMARDTGGAPKWVVAVVALIVVGFVLLTIRGC